MLRKGCHLENRVHQTGLNLVHLVLVRDHGSAVLERLAMSRLCSLALQFHLLHVSVESCSGNLATTGVLATRSHTSYFPADLDGLHVKCGKRIDKKSCRTTSQVAKADNVLKLEAGTASFQSALLQAPPKCCISPFSLIKAAQISAGSLSVPGWFAESTSPPSQLLRSEPREVQESRRKKDGKMMKAVSKPLSACQLAFFDTVERNEKLQLAT